MFNINLLEEISGITIPELRMKPSCKVIPAFDYFPIWPIWATKNFKKLILMLKIITPYRIEVNIREIRWNPEESNKDICLILNKIK